MVTFKTIEDEDVCILDPSVVKVVIPSLRSGYSVLIIPGNETFIPPVEGTPDEVAKIILKAME